MVRSAKDWKWSSYRAMIGLKNTPEWLDTDGVLLNFEGHKAEAVEAYKHFDKKQDTVDFGRGQQKSRIRIYCPQERWNYSKSDSQGGDPLPPRDKK